MKKYLTIKLSAQQRQRLRFLLLNISEKTSTEHTEFMTDIINRKIITAISDMCAM